MKDDATLQQEPPTVEPGTPGFRYAAFLSYSTDPDYALARDLERFLESFHKQIRQLPDGTAPRPLSVCRDGSDFSIASIRSTADGEAGENRIRDTIRHYLEQSEFLIVLCSMHSARSEYVAFEIDWFLKHRPDNILLVVTEGSPERDASVFAPSLQAAGRNRAIFFDLRGWRKEQRGLPLVRNFEDARVNLASHLLGFTEGEVLPVWQREERERGAKRGRVAAAVAGALGTLLIAAVSLLVRTVLQNRELRSDLFIRESSETMADDAARAVKLALDAGEARNTASARGQLLRALAPLTNIERILPVHRSEAPAVAFAPDGAEVYSIAADYSFAVTGAPTFERFARWMLPHERAATLQLTSGTNPLPFGGATDLAVSGNAIVIGTQHGHVLFIRARGTDTPNVFQDFSQDAPVLAIAASAERAIAADDAGFVTLYRRTPTGYVLDRRWRAHRGSVYDVAIGPALIATTGGDGVAKLWRFDGSLDTTIQYRPNGGGAFTVLAFAPNGHELALGGYFGDLQLYDVDAMRRETVDSLLKDRVRCLAYHPSGHLLAACSGNELVLFDVRKRARRRVLVGHTRPAIAAFQQVSAAAFAPDGRTLVTTGEDGRLFARDITLHEFDSTFFNITTAVARPAIASVLAHFDRDVILVGQSGDGALTLRDDTTLFRFDLSSASLDPIWRSDSARITATAMLGDSVAAGGADGAVRLIDPRSGRVTSRITPTRDSIEFIDVSSNRKTLIATTTNRDVIRAEASDTTGLRVRDVSTSNGQIYGIALSPDARYLTLSSDGTHTLQRIGLQSRDTLNIEWRQQFPASQIVVDAQGVLRATATTGGEITFYRSTRSGVPEPRPASHAHDHAIKTARLVEPLDLLVTMDERRLCLWETSSATLLACIDEDEGYSLTSLIVDRNAENVFYLSAKRFLYRVPLRYGAWKSIAKRIIAL